MRQNVILLSIVFIISPCLFVASAGASADEYLHDFERRSDLEAWQPYDDDVGCALANPGSGGNPGGYLQMSCAGAFVGAWTRSPDFTGKLTGSRWVLSFDIANFGARSATIVDILLFGGETSWIYYGTLSAANNGVWTTYGLTFDPAWSDDQARANHWAPAATNGASFASWADTMKRVEAVGFRASEETANVSAVRIGLDNVRLRTAP